MATPRLRITQACRRLGHAEVADRCRRMLEGDDADPEFIVTLGGDAAVRLLGDGVRPGQEYWLRVWAARGLLWAGPSDALEPLRNGLADEHWRVREMVCKVIARHRLGDLLDDVGAMRADPVERVRIAATRAETRIVAGEA